MIPTFRFSIGAALSLVIAAQAAPAGAQAFLLRDVYPGATTSQPFSGYDLTDVNGTLFFAADNSTNGEELWKSDGTTAGTVLVRDIRAGNFDASPRDLAAVNELLFFTANDGSSGIELWKSDGTSAGTTRVRDIFPGTSSSSPARLVDYDGTLFFIASNGTNGTELWKSDGTSAGTLMVKDIWPGSSSSNPSGLTAWNGLLYFAASSSGIGQELWVSDGTDGGTVLLADLNPGTPSSSPSAFTPSGGSLFFTSDLSTTQQKLWKTDGTTSGTTLVRTFTTPTTAAELLYLTDANGTLFFRTSDPVSSRELWKSDGTTAGTVLVADIRNPGSSDPVFLANVNGILYFAATDNDGDRELWRSDGSLAGTFRVKDIRPGTPASSPQCFLRVQGTLLFRANDGVTGIEPWKSDGTDSGTELVRDIRSAGDSFSGGSDCYPVVSGGFAYFAADNGTTGIEIWALPLDVLDFFTATSTDGRNRLEWLNPISGTPVQIRYSTAAAPTNLNEGTPLTVPGGTPGAPQSLDHSGLANDVTVHYTAFLENASGVVASRSTRGRPTAGRVRWVFQSGATSLSPPGIGSVYGVSNDRVLYSMRPGAGGGDWPAGWKPFLMPAPAQGRPPVVPVTVGSASKVTFLGSQDGRVYAVDANSGALVWKSADLGVLQAVPGGIFTRFPPGQYDLILVGSRNTTGANGVHGLRLSDGTTAWSFVNSAAQGGDDLSMGVISGQASVDYQNNLVYVASRSRAGGSPRTVWCLSFDDAAASLVWSRGTDSSTRINDVDGSPVLLNGRLYVGTNDGRVHALDAATGSDLWSSPFVLDAGAGSDGAVKSYVWPESGTGNLYLSTTNVVWSLRDVGSSASENWRLTSIASPSAPLFFAWLNVLYVGSSDGNLYEIPLGGAGVPSPSALLIGDGSASVGSPSFDVQNFLLYVGTEAGAIYAVSVP
jgi:ELWxxDGT repeat protein